MTRLHQERADSARWTDGQPFVVHRAMVETFTYVKNLKALTCGFCMQPIGEGDTARWLYIPTGSNTFVCAECDSPDAVTRWAEKWRIEIAPILRRWGG